MLSTSLWAVVVHWHNALPRSEVTTPKTWLADIGKITPAPPATPTAPASCDVGDMESCTTTWYNDFDITLSVPSRSLPSSSSPASGNHHSHALQRVIYTVRYFALIGALSGGAVSRLGLSGMR